MRPETWWGLYNFSTLVSVHQRRREAAVHAERLCGDDWRRYYQCKKVVVGLQD